MQLTKMAALCFLMFRCGSTYKKEGQTETLEDAAQEDGAKNAWLRSTLERIEAKLDKAILEGPKADSSSQQLQVRRVENLGMQREGEESKREGGEDPKQGEDGGEDRVDGGPDNDGRFWVREAKKKIGPPCSVRSCGSFEVLPTSSARANLCKPSTSPVFNICEMCKPPDMWKFQYLPEAKVQGFDSDTFDDAVSAVHNLQAGAAACSSNKKTNQLVGWKPSGYGLGHNLMDVLAQFTQSYRWQLPMEFVAFTRHSDEDDRDEDEDEDPWNFANNSFCKGVGAPGWGCYFKPLTRCRTHTASSSPPTPWVVDNAMDQFTLMKGFENHGLVWAQAVLLKHVWQLTDEFANHAKIAEQKRAMGSEPGWIGIHVRHGDSGYNNGWQDYLEAAKAIRAKYSASKIFLATDDPQVAKECTSKKTKAQGFTCLVAAGVDRDVYAGGSDTEGGWLEARMHGTKLTRKQMEDIPVGCFVDWELLAGCDYFIGDMTRSFFKIALLLHIGRRHQIPPIISFAAGDFNDT
jgi:hypothetical protein